MLRAAELDAGLQVGSHQSGAEWKNPLPRPDAHTACDAAQDTVGLLGCKCTLVAHVWLFIHQYRQVLLGRAALNPFSAQPVFVLAIASTHVQGLALGLVELCEFHTGPLLELVRVPLDGVPSFWCVNCTTQLGVDNELIESTLNPTVCIVDDDG